MKDIIKDAQKQVGTYDHWAIGHTSDKSNHCLKGAAIAVYAHWRPSIWRRGWRVITRFWG